MSYIENKTNEIRDKFCPPGDYDYSDIFDAIIAALTPPEGYVLVPVEPTDEMLTALVSNVGLLGRKSYSALIAARPEVK